MAVLTGMSDVFRGKHYEISDERVSIGRAADNTIPIENVTVSGRHCEIIRDEEGFLLRDLGSTNGTRVNSRDITESRLRPRDIVQVGSVEFVFNAEPSEVGGEYQGKGGLATDVEEEVGAVSAPPTFSSISPFAQRKKGPNLWTVLISLVGVAALLLVAFLLYRLVTTN